MGFRVVSAEIQEAVSVGDAVRFYPTGSTTERGGDHDREDQVKDSCGEISDSSLLTATLCLARPADGATLYITNTSPNRPRSSTPTPSRSWRTIQLGQGQAQSDRLSPRRKDGVVVYDKSHDLGVIDAESRKLVRRVKIGGNPYQPRVHPRRPLPPGARLVERHEQRRGDLLRPQGAKIDGRVEVSTWPATRSSPATASCSRLGRDAGDVTVIDVPAQGRRTESSTAAVTRWGWRFPWTARPSTRPRARTR